jgi:hypothetical protein
MQKKATAVLISTGVAGLIAGGVLMSSMSANAADDTTSGTTSSTSSSESPGQPPSGTGAGKGAGKGAANGNTDPTKPMRNDEQLLTGTTLEKVTAAVRAKYPDATFQRVETDSDGVYEAHVLVDGKPVTVEVNKSFEVTGTESAPTGSKPSGQPPQGQAPAA